MKSLKINFILTLLLSVMTMSIVLAQTADIPTHMEKVNIDFEHHEGKSMEIITTDLEQTVITKSDFKQIKRQVSANVRAPFIQLHFAEVNLGENSYITIRSLFDNDTQHFNAKTIAVWDNWSAFFKGGDVEVTLFVAPNEQNISLKVSDLLVGDFLDGDDATSMRSQCGPNDDRTSSSVPLRDGRLMPLGCTGWNTAAGYYATAGHCLNVPNSSLQIMEFDVPSSLANGTTVPAATINQYPVDYSSRVFQEAGIGDDWGFYDVGINSSSGLTPLQARRSFYHLSKSNPTGSIRIRGFGTDDEPPGSSGFRNADNQTLQFHDGPIVGENGTGSDIDWEYQTDTEGGNSGSAIQGLGFGFHTAIGIHSHAGCSTAGGSSGNHGTSFEANDTEVAMNIFYQAQVEYVDVDHHLSGVTGTAVIPHQSLQTALNQANAGHGPAESALELILITGSNRLGSGTTETGGNYEEVISYSGATNGVILRATAGAVRIYPPPPAPNNGETENSTNTEVLQKIDTETKNVKIETGYK